MDTKSNERLSPPPNYKYETNHFSEYFDNIVNIGEGGFGRIYKARHKVDKATYAVKKISFRYKDDVQQNKILLEAQQLARLKHPNIVHYNNAWLEKGGDDESSEGSSESDTSPTKNTPDTEEDDQETSQFDSNNDGHEDTNDAPDKEESVSNKLNNLKTTKRRRHSSGATCSSADFSNNEVSLNEKEEENLCQNIISNQKMEEMVIRATLHIQMEYCDYDLCSWLESRISKTGNEALKHLKILDIFYQILSGVEYIHSKSIIHRDLKPSNIFLMKENGVVKIGDFGLARLVDETQICSNNKSACNLSSILGTPPYCAPEQKESHDYDFKVDIYSLGIIFLELSYPCGSVMEFSFLVDKFLSRNYPPGLSHEQIDLIKHMTECNPQNRPTVTKILQNRLFKQKSIKKRIKELGNRITKITKDTSSLEEFVSLTIREQVEFYDEYYMLTSEIHKLRCQNRDLQRENRKLRDWISLQNIEDQN